MNWNEDISKDSLEFMEWLGNFSPTSGASNKEMKGYMIDEEGDAGKVYMGAEDLENLAIACIEVAVWLKKRALKEATR